MNESWTQAAVIFIVVVGTVLLLTILALSITGLRMYRADRRQTTHSIRRNYPIIGRFRYIFEHLGEFFRQYFFAMDREEMPFNRAQRSWVYRAAKNVDNTVAFGSTRDIQARHLLLLKLSFSNLGRRRGTNPAAAYRYSLPYSL